MIVEAARLADTPAIVALVNAAYRGPSAARGWTHEAALLAGQRTDAAAIGATLARWPGAILLLREAADAAPVGCVAVVPSDEDPATWTIGMVTVDPPRQAEGLGRRLLAAAEAFAAERGATAVAMTVIAGRDTLIAWYARRGYRLTGRTKPFPYGDPSVGHPLRDDLHFLVLEKEMAEGAPSP